MQMLKTIGFSIPFLFSIASFADAADTILRQSKIYKTADGMELAMEITLPPGWQPTDKRPAILFFHGGGWTGGKPGVFNRQCSALAARGIVCIQPAYRLVDKVKNEPPLVCLQDAASAIRWVRVHADDLGVDSNRIAAGGASAGGHLAAALGLMKGFDDAADDLSVSSIPQALVLYNPVIHNGPGEWGYGYARMGERYRELSPFFHVAVGAPPTLILTGTKDHLVNFQMILTFQKQMQEAGALCEVESYEGQDHSFFQWSNEKGKYYTLTTRAVEEFLISLGWLIGPASISQE